MRTIKEIESHLVNTLKLFISYNEDEFYCSAIGIYDNEYKRQDGYHTLEYFLKKAYKQLTEVEK